MINTKADSAGQHGNVHVSKLKKKNAASAKIMTRQREKAETVEQNGLLAGR